MILASVIIALVSGLLYISLSEWRIHKVEVQRAYWHKKYLDMSYKYSVLLGEKEWNPDEEMNPSVTPKDLEK
jgi:hypothetical protein